MADMYLKKVINRWMSTGTGTNAGVTVTKTGSAGKKHLPLHIAVSGDAAALVTIESPAGTVKWRKRFSAAFAASENFAPGLIEADAGIDLLVKISASTANCEANIGGCSITGS